MASLNGVFTQLIALTGRGEPSEANWESDYHLLRSTAALMEMPSHALLHKISGKSGDSLSLRNLQNGQRLPIMSKAQLLRIFEERMRIERLIIKNACCSSQELVSRVLPLFLLSGLAALLLV